MDAWREGGMDGREAHSMMILSSVPYNECFFILYGGCAMCDVRCVTCGAGDDLVVISS